MIYDEAFEKRFITLRIIWLAMLASLPVYLIVAVLAAANGEPLMSAKTYAVLRMVLYIIACITFIMTGQIKKRILQAGKGYEKPYQDNPHAEQHSAMQRYTTSMIAACAMSESIGIYGLVLFFLGKNRTDLYLFLFASALSMFMCRPKREEITGL